MTLILTDADIRGYYAALGIDLPGWARDNATVRCFADPASHVNDDQHPSASVHLHTGAWQCHGCGARGGAYDAALTCGYTPRTAIELMIAHGLIEPRARITTARELIPKTTTRPSRPAKTRRPTLTVCDNDVRHWQQALHHRPNLLNRLAQERGWTYHALTEIEAGWDRTRLTIPIRDASGDLQGVLRYRTTPAAGPKMIAAPGTRLGFIPHPATLDADHVLLTEGPPDMIAARSRGLPAIAVPGDHAWHEDWAPALTGCTVTIVMDADPPGRNAAQRIHHALQLIANPVILDLAPHRDDGYDLTDWLTDQPGTGAALLQQLRACATVAA